MWLLLSSFSLSRWRLRPDGELHRGAASRVLVLLRQGPVSPGASSANLRGDACLPCVRGLARGAVRGALPPLLSPGKPQASVSLGPGLLPALPFRSPSLLFQRVLSWAGRSFLAVPVHLVLPACLLSPVFWCEFECKASGGHQPRSNTPSLQTGVARAHQHEFWYQ